MAQHNIKAPFSHQDIIKQSAASMPMSTYVCFCVYECLYVCRFYPFMYDMYGNFLIDLFSVERRHATHSLFTWEARYENRFRGVCACYYTCPLNWRLLRYNEIAKNEKKTNFNSTLVKWATFVKLLDKKIIDLQFCTTMIGLGWIWIQF